MIKQVKEVSEVRSFIYFTSKHAKLNMKSSLILEAVELCGVFQGLALIVDSHLISWEALTDIHKALDILDSSAQRDPEHESAETGQRAP